MTSDVCIVRYNKRKFFRFSATLTTTGSCSIPLFSTMTVYGRPLLDLFRKCENFDLKIKKSLCDIEFLNVCLENYLTTKFLNLKLYRNYLRNTSQFQKIQQKLLNNEMFNKTKKLKKLRSDLKIFNNQLKSLVSFLDFPHLLNFIRNVNDKKIKKIKILEF